MKTITFIRRNQTKFGGAENYLSRLSSELTKLGINHKLKYSSSPKWLPTWIKALAFNYNVMKQKKDQFYFSLERITAPDIYRAGDGVHKVYMKIKNSKFNPTNLVYCYLEKRCFKNAKIIIANSNMIKQEIINTYKIDSKKIKIIYNGVKIAPYNKEEAYHKLLQEFPQISNKKIIIFTGNDFKRKGGDAFLKIISKLKYQNYHAFVIGKDKKINQYKELAKNLGIMKKVTFTGQRSDVNNFYSCADIFLFPTRYEPFSNVILEAMSFHCIAFTTKQNGASEILPKANVLSNPEDYNICKDIDEILLNEDKLYNIKAVHFNIVQNFSIEKNVKETLKIINELI